MTNAQYKEHIKVLEEKLSRQSKANEEMTRALHHKNLQIIALSGIKHAQDEAITKLKEEFAEEFDMTLSDAHRLAKRLRLTVDKDVIFITYRTTTASSV